MTDRALNGPVATLLARCWQLEDNDGGWNGGDVVTLLTEWFTEQGIDITHPGHAGYANGDQSPVEVAELDPSLDVLRRYAFQHAYTPSVERPRIANPCRVCDGRTWLPDDGPEYDCDACAGTGSGYDDIVQAARKLQEEEYRACAAGEAEQEAAQAAEVGA